MTNLPVNLPPIKAFEGASRTIRLDMYEGFVVPSQMAFEVWYNRVKQFEVTPTYNSSNRQLTATLTADQVKALPLIAEIRVKFDSSYPFKAQIKPTTEGTDDGVVGYTIQQAGDSYTVIEIYAKDLIDAQVGVATEQAELATTKASDASASASVATTQAGIATTGASTATTKAGESLASATAAANAQAAAEAARDIAVANTVERIYVATYVEAEPYFTGPMPREIYVAADEAYYEGDPSWYKYDPQLGTALLGIDFNYTEE